MHLNGKKFEKLIFLNIVETKDVIFTRYVKSNETMSINKFQRSMLIFQPRSLILESHKYIQTVFSETTRPIELTFHM